MKPAPPVTSTRFGGPGTSGTGLGIMVRNLTDADTRRSPNPSGTRVLDGYDPPYEDRHRRNRLRGPFQRRDPGAAPRGLGAGPAPREGRADQRPPVADRGRRARGVPGDQAAEPDRD